MKMIGWRPTGKDTINIKIIQIQMHIQNIIYNNKLNKIQTHSHNEIK